MMLFACKKQIFFRNVFYNCICFLCCSARSLNYIKRIFNNNIRYFLCCACNFHYIKRIFNNNVKRTLINQYFVFSFIFSDLNLIDLCLLIFAMRYISYFSLLY